MLDEFARYTALQRDQAPLASLLIYLRRKGGYVQLNQIWREMGPTGGGPFWNQTTLINKLDKLERLEIVSVERRILPSPRAEAKKKTNTFYRINPETPIYPYIFSMLRIFQEKPQRYTSRLVDRPLERLCLLAGRASSADPMLGRELDAAMELIGEVFSVGVDEVKRMIKERMESRGMIKGRKRAQGDATQAGDEKQAAIAKKSPRQSHRRKEARELDDEDLEV
jgi:hypothetical protein